MKDRTRRVAVGLVAMLAVGVVAVPAAQAQYTPTTEPEAPPPTTTTTRATTTTTEDTTTTSEAPTTTVALETTEAPRNDNVFLPAPLEDTITPDNPATITNTSDVAFDPDVEPAITTRGVGDSAPLQATVTATINDEGQLVIEVSVPEGTPEGILVVSVVVQDALGRQRTVIYLFPVQDDEDSSELRATGAAASGIPTVTVTDVDLDAAAQFKGNVEEVITELEHQIVEAGPAKVARAVSAGASLTLDGVQLLLDGDAIASSDDAGAGRGIFAAVAVAAAGCGLIVLRRRTSLGAAR
jgi:hypothetical protein